MEEGSKIELDEREFLVLANQPVSFDLYCSSFRTGDRIGDLVNVDDSLSPLPPIQTVIQFGKKAKEASLPVKVEASYTEVGTLAIWCRAIQSNHRWRLQFQLRDQGLTMPVSDQEIFEESLVERALGHLREAFSSRQKETSPEDLARTIADVLERRKEEWPSAFIRRMADQLLLVVSARKLSPEHESRWLNLVGFCLRPGTGDALDEHRIQKLWKLYQEGPIHAKKAQVRSEWWILWRRVSGGLSANQQRIVLQEISSLLKPKKGGPKRKLPSQEHMEIWMAAASMERLPVQDKMFWGRLLLYSLSPKKSRPQYWWALSRIAAREPLYGPIDKVIPPDEVATWTETILSKSWRNTKPVGIALIQMCRLTGDRMRDLEPAVLKRVLGWLTTHECSRTSLRVLENVVPIARKEESAIFGESLPPGILLHPR
jgi:hypothetical protein